MVNRLLEKVSQALKLDSTFEPYLLVALSALIYFLGLAKINPDPHHDGVQFAAASGVAHGLNIHSQVYEQYGPVTAWLQGGVLKLFGSTLLNLRLENVFFLTIAALLLLRILFVVGVPTLAAILVTLVWVVSCPAGSIYPGVFGLWPWSSVISLVLLLANSAMHLESRVRRKALNDAQIFMAGALCSAILFTRFQAGAVASAVNLLLILWSPVRSGASAMIRGAKFLGVFFLTSIAFLAVLFYQGSITNFVDQILVGPLHQYVYPFNWPFFKMYYGLAVIPTTLFLFLGTIAWRRLSQWYARMVAGAIALCVGGLSIFGAWHNGAQLNRTDTWRALFDVQAISYLFASVSLSLIVGFFALALLFSKDFLYPLIDRPGRTGKVLRSSAEIVLGRRIVAAPFLGARARKRRSEVAVLGTLLLLLLPFIVQFYPLADVYHLWWATPLFMVLIPFSLMKFISLRGVNVVIASLLTPALLVSTIMYLNLKQVPRVEITSGALKGMQVEEQYVSSYQAMDRALSPIPAQSSRFYCRDGLFATWNGDYLSVDAAYVSWAWVVKNPPAKVAPTYVFLCTTDLNVDNFARANNVHLVAPVIGYQLSYWSGGGLYKFERNQ